MSAPRIREVINLVDDDAPPPRSTGTAGGGIGGGGGGGAAASGGGGGGRGGREAPRAAQLGPTEYEGIEIVGFKPAPASHSSQISAQLRQRVQLLADMAARSAWQQQQQQRAGGGGGAASSPAKRPRPSAYADAGAAAAKRPSGASGGASAGTAAAAAGAAGAGGAAEAAEAGASPPPKPPPKPPQPAAPQCCLCLDDMSAPAATPCGHMFCHPCILAAVKAQHKCPTCRKPIRSVKGILRVYIP